MSSALGSGIVLNDLKKIRMDASVNFLDTLPQLSSGDIGKQTTIATSCGNRSSDIRTRNLSNTKKKCKTLTRNVRRDISKSCFTVSIQYFQCSN